MGDKWLLHKFEIAVKDLQEYKKHILCGIHKDRADEVPMIFDNAMKFLPQKFREAQTDFFAKKGIKKSQEELHSMIIHFWYSEHFLYNKGLSWHIMVCLWKTEDGQLSIMTMVYLMDNIKQVVLYTIWII